MYLRSVRDANGNFAFKDEMGGGTLFNPDSAYPVPAGIDRYNHLPGGSNVLFMDGHSEFARFPGAFPATQTVVDAFQLPDLLMLPE